MLRWIDTCHGQRRDAQKIKKGNRNQNTKHKTCGFLLQVVVFKVQAQTARKFWLRHAPQFVFL